MQIVTVLPGLTEEVSLLDPSRQLHILCGHVVLLWFNPITCQAQREIRGLCQGSLQIQCLFHPCRHQETCLHLVTLRF